ncbi:MAG: hypothetical protein ACF8PN_05810 [Phycisphaerales bacterium]
MPADASPQPPEIDPRRRSAELLRGVGAAAPDLTFAARFLERDRRDDLYGVAGLARLLAEVVQATPPLDENEDGDGDAASGCGCGADGPDGRATIARNIIDYLYDEADPKQSTGRVELDAVVHAIRRRGLDRGDWRAFIDGLLEWAATNRVATPGALDRRLDAIFAPFIRLLAATLDLRLNENEHQAAHALARGVARARLFVGMRDQWRRDRVWISHRELRLRGMSELDLAEWFDDEDARLGAAEAPWREALEAELDQLEKEIGRGLTALTSAEPRVARTVTLYAGMWSRAARECLSGAGFPEPSPRAVIDRARRRRFRALAGALFARPAEEPS